MLFRSLIVFQTATTDAVDEAPPSSPSSPSLSSSTSSPGSGSELAPRTVLIDAICRAATLAGIARPHRPWLPSLDEDPALGLQSVAMDADCDTNVDRHRDRDSDDDLDVVGVVDDPDGQRRLPLRWRPADGHLLLAGAPGAGVTTALLTVAAGMHRPDAFELFVIDAVGDARLLALGAMPSCAAVVRIGETERVLRVIDAVDAEIAQRRANPHELVPRRQVIVLVDGLDVLRRELDRLDLHDRLAQLDAIVGEGLAVGVGVTATTARPAAVPSTLIGQFADRWVFHLADPLDGSTLGVAPSAVPDRIPGRLIEGRTGREAQIVPIRPLGPDGRTVPVGTGPVGTGPVGAASVGAASVGTGPRDGCNASTGRALHELPCVVALQDLPVPVAGDGDAILPIGLAFDTLRSTQLPIAMGEHVLVLGPSRSGRSTALATIADAWLRMHPGGWVGCVSPRRTSVRRGESFPDLVSLLDAQRRAGAERADDADSADRTDVADGVDRAGGSVRQRLLVIDDAELVDDPSGAFAAAIAARSEGITVVAAARPDSLRMVYGHWTLAVRRSRLGVIMAASTDIDGDLLNIALPRRLPIAARPGLAWLVADGDRHLMQIAMSTDPTGT